MTLAVTGEMMMMNWVLNIVHTLWQVNRVPIHNIMHADMNDREFKAVYVT